MGARRSSLPVCRPGRHLLSDRRHDPQHRGDFSDVTDPTYESWFARGEFVYFTAQNQNDSGDVTCTVTSNGRTVSRNTSSGAYVIATCSGRS